LNWRSTWILGVVALMLLAAWALQWASDGGRKPNADIPAAELTPAAGGFIPGPGSTVAVAETATAAANASPRATTGAASLTPGAGQTSRPADDLERRDLAWDEARGGHTLARHVGKTDAELVARLKAEPDISASSTYRDRDTAERAVGEVLARKKDEVEKWQRRTGSRPNLVLRLDLGEVVGRSVERGSTRAIDVEDAVVVLRWTGDGWYVLTSYPEDR